MQFYIRATNTETADRYIALSRLMTNILDDQNINLKDNSIISPYIFPGLDGQQMNLAARGAGQWCEGFDQGVNAFVGQGKTKTAQH